MALEQQRQGAVQAEMSNDLKRVGERLDAHEQVQHQVLKKVKLLVPDYAGSTNDQILAARQARDSQNQLVKNLMLQQKDERATAKAASKAKAKSKGKAKAAPVPLTPTVVATSDVDEVFGFPSHRKCYASYKG